MKIVWQILMQARLDYNKWKILINHQKLHQRAILKRVWNNKAIKD